MNSCSECVHFRQAKPVDPFAGVRLVSQKALELRAKWQQELATRASFEEQRAHSGLPFDFEPLAYSWCAHFSKEELTDAVSGRRYLLYVLCDHANPNGDCKQFAPRGSAP